jgi:predicted N-formylglutamate amidohydrolase
MATTTPIPHLAPSSLLGPDDPPPYEVINPEGRTPVLLLCDHASNAVPRDLNNLGLPPEVLAENHIAWDLGAAKITRRLAERLGAPAVLTGYSRLLIDCNRQPGDPTSIIPVSDGIVIPGNQNLSDAEAVMRLETFFWPYHHTITNTLAQLWRHGPAPALVAIHSFTPQMRDGEPRPWHVGLLWNHDPRLAVPLIRWLSADPRLCVGDNEPYSGREVGYTMDTHGEAAGLPHVLFEVRQDLVATEAGCEHWTAVLAEALNSVLADPNIHRVQHF